MLLPSSRTGAIDAHRLMTNKAEPVPLAATYFVAINGQQAGPFDIPTLAAKVQSGEVTRGSLVWKAGMAGWTAADQVADLSGLFKAGPPPLPI